MGGSLITREAMAAWARMVLRDDDICPAGHIVALALTVKANLPSGFVRARSVSDLALECGMNPDELADGVADLMSRGYVMERSPGSGRLYVVTAGLGLVPVPVGVPVPASDAEPLAVTSCLA